MLEKLIEKLQRLAATKSTLDPSRFADHVAMQTHWTPMKSGRGIYGAYKLSVVESSRLEFRASMTTIVGYSLLILWGIVTTVGFLVIKLSPKSLSFDAEAILPLLVGSAFLIAGGWGFYVTTIPIVFDKYKGYFWKGRKGPTDVSNPGEVKYYADIASIHALQLLSEYCRKGRTPYYRYEMNLVLEDGNRINLIDYGNPKELRRDAQTLSEFLGKPVWDAT